MHQLVFHGKKTVPSSLRRDHWTPYFSLHFPSSYSGLLAYHHLRELSLQRQLSPPSELVMTIKQHASKERKKRMTDEEKEEWEQNNEGKPYQDGIARLMDKKSRAKVLMNQKATSVADVAFVVGLMEEEGHLRTPSEVEEAMREKRERRLENAGERRRRTLRRNWKREDGEEYKERAVHAQEGTKWGLERYAARRIAMEYGGVVVDAGVLGKTRVVLPGRDENKGGQEQEEETLTDGETTAVSPTTAGGDVPITTTAPPRDPSNPLAVHIFWSDLRDAAYAATWPGIISHGELARMAVSRVAPGGRRTGRKGLTDAKGGAGYIKDRTVHVIGGVKVGEGEEGWMRGKDWSVATTESRDLRYGDGEKVGGRDGEGEAIESKSREEQIEELKREGVVVDPSSSSSSRRGGGGLFGWVKGRLGMGSSQTSSASTSA